MFVDDAVFSKDFRFFRSGMLGVAPLERNIISFPPSTNMPLLTERKPSTSNVKSRWIRLPDNPELFARSFV